jgi:hypothetical protein
LDGEKVDSVTTVIGDGIPKPALVGWAANTTAGYAVDNWDELSGLGVAERLRTLEKARWNVTKAATARGTDVHKLAQRLAAGEEVQVPEPLTGHVDAYLQFVEDWQPREILVEVPVFNRAQRYAGTLDLIADLADGNRWLLDLKTSGSGIWPETALQASAYRNAEFYLDADGREQPMPPVDFCGAVWLRADGYDLHPVEADARAFRVFLYARQVAAFAKAPREEWVHEALSRGAA